MDFVTREQLLDGMAAWMLDKHKPLGEILVAASGAGETSVAG
jgi:hypothetical protein